jgi:hypothetical protein
MIGAGAAIDGVGAGGFTLCWNLFKLSFTSFTVSANPRNCHSTIITIQNTIANMLIMHIHPARHAALMFFICNKFINKFAYLILLTQFVDTSPRPLLPPPPHGGCPLPISNMGIFCGIVRLFMLRDS